MTCAGVIGAWYFAEYVPSPIVPELNRLLLPTYAFSPDAAPPSPTSTHTIHAALTRATSPSLGTIILSALILTLIRLLTLLTLLLRRVPVYVSFRLIVTAAAISVRMLEGMTTALSRHALVYTGLTGDPFFVSARRAKALTDAGSRSRRKLKSERTSLFFLSFDVGLTLLSAPLMLLTVAPLTLTFPFALGTYLFVAHTLNAPAYALGAAVLAAAVTGLVGLFCVGLVEDT